MDILGYNSLDPFLYKIFIYYEIDDTEKVSVSLPIRKIQASGSSVNTYFALSDLTGSYQKYGHAGRQPQTKPQNFYIYHVVTKLKIHFDNTLN